MAEATQLNALASFNQRKTTQAGDRGYQYSPLTLYEHQKGREKPPLMLNDCLKLQLYYMR